MAPPDPDRAAALWRWHLILPSVALGLVAVVYLPAGLFLGMDLWFRVMGAGLVVVLLGWVVPGAWRLRSTAADPDVHPLRVVLRTSWPFMLLSGMVWGILAIT